MVAYSQDLRDRVLRALARGDGVTATARRFEVSVRLVDEVRRRLRVHGERGSRPVADIGGPGCRVWSRSSGHGSGPRRI